MRYLIGCPRFFLDLPGGAERVAWDLAQLARDAGHEVAMLCGADAITPSRELVEGVTIVRYPVPRMSGMNPLRAWATARAARESAERYLRKGATPGWDVVHGHTPATARVTFPLAPGARRVQTVHSPAVLEAKLNWSDGSRRALVKRLAGLPLIAREERNAYNAAGALHVLSDFTRRELAKLYGRAVADKCHKIPGWVRNPDAPLVSKLEARAQLGYPADAKVVYSLRRMTPRMGLDTLIDAAHSLHDVPGLRVVLAGDGPIRAELQARAARGPSHDRIEFPGRLSDERASLAYAAADVFVVPSRALECFGLILLEAMSVGVPVVASSIGAIPEVLGDVFPDGLVPPDDPPALARTLRSVLSGELPVPSPERLIAYTRERYSRAEIGPQYLEFLFPRADAATRREG